jgi:hypothetical protein
MAKNLDQFKKQKETQSKDFFGGLQDPWETQTPKVVKGPIKEILTNPTKSAPESGVSYNPKQEAYLSTL